jgi:catechol 2,3-dioxygenase-like lactoylglutathione lyase family enzyme
MKQNHITIIVTDLQRSVTFYEKLGLELIVLSEPRYARFYVEESDSTFSIEVTESARPMGPEQAHIYFECSDLDETVDRLARAGLVFDQQPTDMFYLWREAHLRDPDGHDIRLYSAGENRINPPWRLKK